MEMGSRERRNRNTREYGVQRRTAYLEGSAAKQLRVAYDAEKLPRKKHLSNTTRKNREKAFRMNPGYVLFLSAALVFAAITLYGYLELQSDITNRVDEISRKEAEYNTLKLKNDEEYNRISSSIDLEKIKAIAIGELGMTYAGEGQIVNVEDSETDYVRQTEKLE